MFETTPLQKHLNLKKTLCYGMHLRPTIYFDDFKELSNKDIDITRTEICMVNLWYGFNKSSQPAVNGIKFTFRDPLTGLEYKDSDILHHGVYTLLGKKQYELSIGEFIQLVKVYTDTGVNKIELITSSTKSRILKAGGDKGFERSLGIPANSIICGCFGGYSDNLDNIGFYYMDKKDWIYAQRKGYILIREMLKRKRKKISEYELTFVCNGRGKIGKGYIAFIKLSLQVDLVGFMNVIYYLIQKFPSFDQTLLSLHLECIHRVQKPKENIYNILWN